MTIILSAYLCRDSRTAWHAAHRSCQPVWRLFPDEGPCVSISRTSVDNTEDLYTRKVVMHAYGGSWPRSHVASRHLWASQVTEIAYHSSSGNSSTEAIRDLALDFAFFFFDREVPLVPAKETWEEASEPVRDVIGADGGLEVAGAATFGSFGSP